MTHDQMMKHDAKVKEAAKMKHDAMMKEASKMKEAAKMKHDAMKAHPKPTTSK